MSTIIAPSILAADFANLQRDVEMINNSDGQVVNPMWIKAQHSNWALVKSVRINGIANGVMERVRSVVGL